MPFDDPCLDALHTALEDIAHTGLEHGLFFERADWLLGWRTGIPGAGLNNLWATLGAIREQEPTNAALAFWKTRRKDLAGLAKLFAGGCIQYLLAERLAQTLSKALPETLPRGLLKEQREALFGPPMQAVGPYKILMETL